VRVATHFKAEIIIAVDLRGLLPNRFPTNLFGVLMRSAEIMLLWQSEDCVREADVIIRPKLDHCGTFQKDENEMIYQAGRDAAQEMIPQIKQLLQNRACAASK
jgi:NTE family protein